MKSYLDSNDIINSHPIHYTIFFDFILKSIPEILDGINSQTIKDKYLSVTGTPDIKTWIMLYRNSKYILYCIILEFINVYSKYENLSSLIYFHIFLSKESQIEIINQELDIYNSLSEKEKVLYIAKVRSFQKELKDESDEILKDNFDYISDKQAKDHLSKIEILFLIYVIMPCLIHYGELPSLLLRKARLGDLDALKKIVQIDNSCIFDSKISKIMHNLSITDRKSYTSICKMLIKNPKTISESKVKTALIGLLSKVSKLYSKALKNPPLTSEQIRSRFDSYAKSQGLGDIDIHLPLSPEAFYKQKCSPKFGQV